MTPDERLEYIKDDFDRNYPSYSQDTKDGVAHSLFWLIDRVKELTEALEKIAAMKEGPVIIAREALTGSTPKETK